jgi:hypothetical protein
LPIISCANVGKGKIKNDVRKIINFLFTTFEFFYIKYYLSAILN